MQSFDLGELIAGNKFSILLFLVGVICLGLGVFMMRDGIFSVSDKVEIIESNTLGVSEKSDLTVEIAGAVENPGVYKLDGTSRVEDLLIASGGLSVDADRTWVEKTINRAAKLVDGQKLFIPRMDQQTEGESAKNIGGIKQYQGNQGGDDLALVNINTASQKELESLWGIGPVYAQNIIEHRPYSTVEELVKKDIIKSNVYERNKDLMTVY